MTGLKQIALAFAMVFSLAACGGGDEPVKNEALAKLIKVGVETSCSVSPSLVDIGTAVASVQIGPVAGAINVLAKGFIEQICSQWKTKQTVKSAADDGCIAVINGVCIRKEK